MKVLIGVDPHKASLAVAAVDEAKGQLLERASFPQNRAGLRALERWQRRFPERRWAVENAGGLGRYLAGMLAGSGESVVDVPPKLSARVRVLSSGNARKNDGVDALATALAASRNERLAAVDPQDSSEVLRLLSERREDLVAERTRALNRLHGLLRDLLPGGVTGTLSADRAARILRGIRPQSSSAARATTMSTSTWVPSMAARATILSATTTPPSTAARATTGSSSTTPAPPSTAARATTLSSATPPAPPSSAVRASTVFSLAPAP
jgi:transposase